MNIIDKLRNKYYNVLQKGVLHMTVSLRLNNADSQLIRAYAEMNGISVSEVLRKSALERIEDEFDLKAYEVAMDEYRANPVTYSLEEVMRELDLS